MSQMCRLASRRADRMTQAPDEPVLPDRSADDEDSGWGERAEADDALERYRAERPPHHGD